MIVKSDNNDDDNDDNNDDDNDDNDDDDNDDNNDDDDNDTYRSNTTRDHGIEFTTT